MNIELSRIGKEIHRNRLGCAESRSGICHNLEYVLSFAKIPLNGLRLRHRDHFILIIGADQIAVVYISRRTCNGNVISVGISRNAACETQRSLTVRVSRRHDLVPIDRDAQERACNRIFVFILNRIGEGRRTIVDNDGVIVDSILRRDFFVRSIRILRKNGRPGGKLDMIFPLFQFKCGNAVSIGRSRRAQPGAALLCHNAHLNHHSGQCHSVCIRYCYAVCLRRRLRPRLVFRRSTCREDRTKQRKTEQGADQQHCLQSFAHNLPPKIFSLPARKREKSE